MLSLFSALRSGAGLFVWRSSRLVPLKREPGAPLRQARRRRGWSGRFSWCECSGGQLRECQRISCPRLALGGDRDRFTGGSRVRRPRGTGRAPNLSARSRSLSHDWVGFGFELRGADFLCLSNNLTQIGRGFRFGACQKSPKLSLLRPRRIAGRSSLISLLSPGTHSKTRTSRRWGSHRSLTLCCLITAALVHQNDFRPTDSGARCQ